jgi:hypothetical protein
VTARRRFDALLALWVVVWIVLGIAAGREVRRLADISDAERQAGVATQRAGDLLESLSGVPLIGDRLRAPAATIREAGQGVIASADAARDRTRRAGTLLGIAIAAVPTLPLLLLYLPPRLAFERDRRRITGALRGGGPGIDALLATRAVAHLPYGRLLDVSADPLGDLRAGRHEALAGAELARLELRRP